MFVCGAGEGVKRRGNSACSALDYMHALLPVPGANWKDRQPSAGKLCVDFITLTVASFLKLVASSICGIDCIWKLHDLAANKPGAC